MDSAEEIGTRLRQFGQKTFGSGYGWVKEFARALDMAPTSLSNYMSGVRRPGNALQARLRDIGCDIEWLMTGEKSGTGKKKSDTEAFVAFHAPSGVSEETKRAVQKMIDGLLQLEPGQIDQARRIIKEAFRKKK